MCKSAHWMALARAEFHDKVPVAIRHSDGCREYQTKTSRLRIHLHDTYRLGNLSAPPGTRGARGATSEVSGHHLPRPRQWREARGGHPERWSSAGGRGGAERVLAGTGRASRRPCRVQRGGTCVGRDGARAPRKTRASAAAPSLLVRFAHDVVPFGLPVGVGWGLLAFPGLRGSNPEPKDSVGSSGSVRDSDSSSRSPPSPGCPSKIRGVGLGHLRCRRKHPRSRSHTLRLSLGNAPVGRLSPGLHHRQRPRRGASLRGARPTTPYPAPYRVPVPVQFEVRVPVPVSSTKFDEVRALAPNVQVRGTRFADTFRAPRCARSRGSGGTHTTVPGTGCR